MTDETNDAGIESTTDKQGTPEQDGKAPNEQDAKGELKEQPEIPKGNYKAPELPLYVANNNPAVFARAGKVKDVLTLKSGEGELVIVGQEESLKVSVEYMQGIHPEVGDYFLSLPGGATSKMRGEVFEKNYTKVPETD